MNHCPPEILYARCLLAALCIAASVLLIACLRALQKQQRATQETTRQLLDIEGARELAADPSRLSCAQPLPTPLSLKRACRCAECGMWVAKDFMFAIEGGGIFQPQKGSPWGNAKSAPPLVACGHCLDALPYPDYEHWVTLPEESSDE